MLNRETIEFARRKISTHWNNPYRGAGILFFHKPAAGVPEVFLAKRRIPPGANQWSIIGGEQEEQDLGCFLRNAIREANEETCGHAELTDYLRDYLMAPVGKDDRIQYAPLIWYQWQTFAVQFSRKPDPAYWPVREGEFNYEFSDAGWFSIHNLPKPLNRLTVCLIGKLRKRCKH